MGSAITNKAVAEKKIIGIGKRNDGVREINAGGALWLPVDWNSATRPAVSASSTCTDLHTAKSSS